MSAQGRLLLYVMQHNKCSEEGARAWLDRNCPRWQCGAPVPDGVIYQEERQEVADDPA